MSSYLSKSDFQLASTCPKKLVYKKSKKKYPTTNDTNEYMEMLAQGGYIVGTMATLMYPEGIEIDGDTKQCIEETNKYLKQEKCVLFEPAIVSGQKLVRVDILIKDGKNFTILEVKAKSHDSEDSIENSDENSNKKSKKIEKKYIEDVAYQYHVLHEAFPDHKINCYLFTPDKAKRTEIDGLAGWFTIDESKDSDEKEVEELPAQPKPKFKRPHVIFNYDSHKDREKYIKQLQEVGILNQLDVQEEVLSLQGVVKERTDLFLKILNEEIKDNYYELTKACKTCEFKMNQENELDGFLECWGDMAYKDNHIFDLYYGGAIGHYTKGYYLDELIMQGKSDLFDIDKERLKDSKGEYKVRAIRQIIQMENTKTNTEWISNELSGVLKKLEYPLHFIDFETYIGALPFHKNMRPYELVAFQWSCHTIEKPGDTPKHSEWIHVKDFPANEFPNFEFARKLKDCIGDSGTPLMWSHHENTVLKTIISQMEVHNFKDDELESWLTEITSESDKKNAREGRLVDMCRIATNHYFHPQMKGRVSIKSVLPAIWSNFRELHEVPHFKEYAPEIFLEGELDPYDTLKAKSSDASGDEDVSSGTDAMRAYYRIRFDDKLTDEQRNNIIDNLLRYCRLDTMAMVIIAHHWGLK